MSDDKFCGKWMPRKQTYCARGAGHPPPCATPESMDRQRNRARKRDRVIRPEDKARWNRTEKFSRLGITADQFSRMLEGQEYACAICREPFKDQRVCVDHDHACCPVPPNGRTRLCGKCIRGLLCARCNTWLGWMEKHSEMAKGYLAKVEA